MAVSQPPGSRFSLIQAARFHCAPSPIFFSKVLGDSVERGHPITQISTLWNTILTPRMPACIVFIHSHIWCSRKAKRIRRNCVSSKMPLLLPLRWWWNCQLVRPPWKTVWKFLKKLKTDLPLTRCHHGSQPYNTSTARHSKTTCSSRPKDKISLRAKKNQYHK